MDKSMKTIQRIGLALSAFGLMTGCQLTSSEPLYPTANQKTIQSAKYEFKGMEELEVSDDGVISFRARLPGPDYYWEPYKIKQLSYEISCVFLTNYVDRGMVVKSSFLGARGRVEYYDMERCMDNTPFE
ncbi:hypothetical protein D5E86_23025 [Vibrio parahaemolyticus]|nr:hypothetical protein [Vibrio parahaemolyticus]OKY28615.1 hypothetical protein BTU71_21765 [Vibrio parahaemolyticus]TBT24577.1 hypothetical protein D5E86_23025 [Vibrio parahaemolyticus]TNZ99537.1 hypothetical protein CGK35_22445 [Vibrio parahaemolyticus]TOI17943.1 hypothetical protein CGI65_21775 [Vibrio parahaemolyticus]